MSQIRRVVLDTSTLVSAALRTGSIPHQALLKVLSSCEVCACAETLSELEEVMNREKFDLYLSKAARQAFVRVVGRNAHLFALQNVDMAFLEPPCRDPRDTQFLALALIAEADVLVTSDDDLLVLNPWRGVPILRPAEFLATPDRR
jgi:putative PIN family toxin of toxin-antitoxin system